MCFMNIQQLFVHVDAIEREDERESEQMTLRTHHETSKQRAKNQQTNRILKTPVLFQFYFTVGWAKE